jgi:predicted benzoate:H+ symporter BenE
MSGPGDRLRAFASRWCCADTMTRLIDPLIADLQALPGVVALALTASGFSFVNMAGSFPARIKPFASQRPVTPT